MSLTLIAFWLTYVGGICAALFNPIAGVLLYILVYHLNPETQWWGETIGGLGLRLSFTTALATGIGLLIRWPRLERGARQFPAPYVLALLLGVIAVGSLTWGVGVTSRGLYQAEKYAKLMIMLFILLRSVRTPLHYHCVIMAWLVGVLYIGYEAAGGAGRMQAGRLADGLGGPDFCESSDLAVHIVGTLPLIGAMFFMLRTWWMRLFVLATGAFAINTLIATRTRNALPGLAVIALATLFSLPKGYRVKALVATVAGVSLAARLCDPGWWSRMATVLHYEHDQSATMRLALWVSGLRMAFDHPFGIGLGNFHTYVMEYLPQLNITRGAHNTLIACLAETGWPGLAIFLSILAITLFRLMRLQRDSQPWATAPQFTELQFLRWRTRFHLGWHAYALRTALLGYLVSALFTTRLFAEDLWILLGLSMCLENIGRTMAARQADEHTPAAAGPAPPPARLTRRPGPAEVRRRTQSANRARPAPWDRHLPELECRLRLRRGPRYAARRPVHRHVRHADHGRSGRGRSYVPRDPR